MIQSLADEIAHYHAENCQEADELLREIVTADRLPTYSELVYFKSKLNWDDREVNNQRRRMHHVMHHQAIAGTVADREAAIKARDEAAAVLKSEGTKIADKIAKLQQQLEAMERDVRRTSKRCDDQAEAVSKLQELVPTEIKQRFNMATRAIKQSLGRSLYDVETRLNEIDCCLHPDKYPNEAEYLAMLKVSCPKAVRKHVDRSIESNMLSEEWPAIRSSMESEQKELLLKRAELKEKFDSAMADARSLCDYYTKD